MTHQPTKNQLSKFDDADYPAFTMGRAAEMIGVQPEFLRGLDARGFLRPHRSAGGHRRYTRAELTLASRVRKLVDEGMPLAAACRIADLERQLHEARAHLDRLAGR